MPFLDGRSLAATVRAELRERIATHHLRPTLGVLLVGSDPASRLYVSLKERAAQDIGAMVVRAEHAELTTSEAIQQIHTWNTDPAIHGILVQLPLPIGLDTEAIIAAIDPTKDVDSFHPAQREALERGEGRMFSPVHLAVLKLLAASPVQMNGAHILLLAKSPIFRDPLARLLKKAGAIVDTSDTIPSVLHTYQVVITAIGRAGSLRGERLNPEAVIIDISTNPQPNATTVGDFVADTLLPTQYASPVPGGVGPLTIAYLLQNLVQQALARTERF